MPLERICRLLGGTLALFWLPPPSLCFGQGVYVPARAVNSQVNGILRPVAGATITVCAANTSGLPCSPALANTLFKDSGLTQPLANPTTTDANGNYPQMALAGGNYTITETAAGFVGFSYQLTVNCSPGACTVTTLTVTGIATVGGLTSTGPNTLGGTTTTGLLVPSSASSQSIGTPSLPYLNLQLGGAGGANNNTNLTTIATTSRSVVFPDAAGNVILDSATQTLTNKTLTAPSMSVPSITSGPVAAGTQAGLAGTGACATITTQTGGAWAGSAKCTGTTGASTLTITPGTTAPNGWVCDAWDETTRANQFQQTSHTTTTCVLTVTSVTQNDVFVFKAVAF